MACSREAHATLDPDGYQARDLQRLTNRRASSSVTPDYAFALESLAEETSNRQTIATADKRPTSRPCDPQTPNPEGIIRRSSFSSVKEDDSGRRFLLDILPKSNPTEQKTDQAI